MPEDVPLPISPPLKRMQERLKARYQDVIRVGPVSAAVTHRPTVIRCLRCHDAGYLLDKRNPELIGQMIECPTCQMIAHERTANAVQLDPRLGFTRQMQRGGLMEMQPTKGQGDAHRVLVDFAARPAGWVVVFGARGSGKTTLLAATIASIRAGNIGALFTVGTDLFELLKDTFGDASPDKGRFAELVERIKAAPVLAIDDLREIRRTEWADALLFRLLNDRYNAAAPTIVSMYESPDVAYSRGFVGAHPDAEPNEAIRSRLRDRRLVTIVGCGATDLRAVDLEPVLVDGNAF